MQSGPHLAFPHLKLVAVPPWPFGEQTMQAALDTMLPAFVTRKVRAPHHTRDSTYNRLIGLLSSLIFLPANTVEVAFQHEAGSRSSLLAPVLHCSGL